MKLFSPHRYVQTLRLMLVAGLLLDPLTRGRPLNAVRAPAETSLNAPRLTAEAVSPPAAWHTHSTINHSASVTATQMAEQVREVAPHQKHIQLVPSVPLDQSFIPIASEAEALPLVPDFPFETWSRIEMARRSLRVGVYAHEANGEDVLVFELQLLDTPGPQGTVKIGAGGAAPVLDRFLGSKKFSGTEWVRHSLLPWLQTRQLVHIRGEGDYFERLGFVKDGEDYVLHLQEPTPAAQERAPWEVSRDEKLDLLIQEVVAIQSELHASGHLKNVARMHERAYRRLPVLAARLLSEYMRLSASYHLQPGQTKLVLTAGRARGSPLYPGSDIDLKFIVEDPPHSLKGLYTMHPEPAYYQMIDEMEASLKAICESLDVPYHMPRSPFHLLSYGDGESTLDSHDVLLAIHPALTNVPSGSGTALQPVSTGEARRERHWPFGRDGSHQRSRRNTGVITDPLGGWLVAPNTLRMRQDYASRRPSFLRRHVDTVVQTTPSRAPQSPPKDFTEAHLNANRPQIESAFLKDWAQLTQSQRDLIAEKPGHLAALMTSFRFMNLKVANGVRQVSEFTAKMLWRAAWHRFLKALLAAHTIPLPPSASLHVGNRPGEAMADLPGFQTHRAWRMESYVLRDSPDPSDLPARLTRQILAAYSLIQREPLTEAQLIPLLQQAFPSELLLNTPETLRRALEWLSLKGFPLRHDGVLWSVEGMAKEFFYTLDIDAWPEAHKLQWESLIGNASPWAVTERLKLIKAMVQPHHPEFTWELLADASGKKLSALRKLMEQWHKKKGPSIDSDTKIQELARGLGLPAEWIWRGQSRFDPLPDTLIAQLTGMTERGPRVRELRAWSGIGLNAFIQRLDRRGIRATAHNFTEFEHGRLRNVKDVRGYPAMADILHQPVFLILEGHPDPESALTALPQTARLESARYAKGFSQDAFGKRLGVSGAQIRLLEISDQPIKPKYQKAYETELGQPLAILFDAPRPSVALPNLAKKYTSYLNFILTTLDHNDQGLLVVRELIRQYTARVVDEVYKYKRMLRSVSDVVTGLNARYVWDQMHAPKAEEQPASWRKAQTVFRELVSEDRVIFIQQERIAEILLVFPPTMRRIFKKNYSLPLSAEEEAALTDGYRIADTVETVQDKILAELEKRPPVFLRARPKKSIYTRIKRQNRSTRLLQAA